MAELGKVDRLTKKTLSGWVWADDEEFPEVQLTVNGKAVSKTRAIHPEEADEGRRRQRFFFPLKDLRLFLKSGDKVACSRLGTELEQGPKTKVKGRGKGRRSTALLQKKLSQGYVFNKKGGLQLSKLKNPSWQTAVFESYRALAAFFEEELEYTLFPAYGTLLGAVRDGGFIGHDDDFDSAYISKFETIPEIRAEIAEIGRKLAHAGFKVEAGVSCLRAALSGGTKPAYIDIFHAFWDEQDRFVIPFGVAGTTPYTRADLTGWGNAKIGEEEIIAPADPDKFLAWIYGDTWRIPDPTFNWARQAQIRLRDAYPLQNDRRDIFWDDYHRHAKSSSPGAFAIGREEVGKGLKVVCDLGCGLGGDLFQILGENAAMRGIGIDRSAVAIERAGAEAEKLGLADRAIFDAVDLNDAEAVDHLFDALDAIEGRKAGVLFVANRLFDTIETGAVEVVMKALSTRAKPGDYLAINQRQFKTRELPKLAYRRNRALPNIVSAVLEGRKTARVVHLSAKTLKGPGFTAGNTKGMTALRQAVIKL